jgi:hypothetical protein
MQERESFKKTPGEQLDLDQRLAAFYGPGLREQPLAQSSWLRLQRQLSHRRSRMHWHLPKLRVRRVRGYKNHAMPAYVRDAFARIAYEARIPARFSSLHCTVNRRLPVPSVRVSLLRNTIKLALPSNAEQAVAQSALDVLLATGLARRLSLRKTSIVLLRLLVVGMLLVSFGILLTYWLDSKSTIVFPIVAVLSVATLILIHVAGRMLAFRADDLVRQWLGRSRTCQGLHALADRSRSPYRGRWSEPSLAERIARVCGSRIEVEDERLTLVR